MEEGEVLLRLLAATLAGAVLGFDRELHRKAAGLRTLMLVGLGSSLFTIVGLTELPNATDPMRVVQGVITGIGFLGGGVILQREEEASVTGITTAASIWLVAAMGVGFGLGRWFLTGTALVLSLLVLVAGRALERWLHRVARTD
jgi:putative Mg2+ transporter-C (MgtC) family protein